MGRGLGHRGRRPTERPLATSNQPALASGVEMRIFRAFAIRGLGGIRLPGSIVLAGLPLVRAPQVLTEEENMAFYEHVFIARPEISPQQVDTLVEELTKTIKELGGNTTKTEYWGLRNLTYRIRKNRKGHYALINIDAPAPVVHEFERRAPHQRRRDALQDDPR